MLAASSGSIAPVLAGVASGLQFDPLAAAVSGAVSAALVGYPGAPRTRVVWATLVLLAGWAVGDGVRIAASSQPPLFLLTWLAVGLLVGYAVPVVVGAMVGRRVVRGTGWLSAAAVVVLVAPALSLISGQVADSIWRLA